ncbi:unnamed protein product [Adineta ricciae]|uniref:Uncharacterized protein n=1 Tax=Adineta ricciae TaxID=249248 RepID=A0A816ANR6_ADIRI|nr:unnamed protein product [Adineta ricciae]
MATASNLAASNNSKLETHVKCAICLDFYDDPRLLSCSHTFCYKCIEKLCEDGMGQCPMRDNSIIFKHTIHKLPINRVAKDLVESIQKSFISQSKCEQCKQSSSEFHCETCSKHYCTICLRCEHDLNEFKAHTIHFIVNANSNHCCAEHTEEKLKYWCQICEQMVCSDCLLFQHQHHSFVQLIQLKDKIQMNLQSSIQKLTSMKNRIEQLSTNASEDLQRHYRTHVEAKGYIERTFDDLQAQLEQRKSQLITQLTLKDTEQQQLIKENRDHLGQFLKTLYMRELFIKQLLKCEDINHLVEMNTDSINYSRLIEEQYEEFLQEHTFDLQYFLVGNASNHLQTQIKSFGEITTCTFVNDGNHIRQLTNLSQLSGKEKPLQLNGTYAYGYRFDLKAAFKLRTLRIKAKLHNCKLKIFIIDHRDILREQKDFNPPSYHSGSTRMNWINIPIHCQIEHNYGLFLWVKSNGNQIPFIAYKDSDHNLRRINEQMSVRSKRAQIDRVESLKLSSKMNVLYDGLCSIEIDKEVSIPALEIILDI